MSTEENKKNVVRWRQEIWNNRNLGVIDELAAPDYVGHMGILGPVHGPQALKDLFGAYLAAFDGRVVPEFVIAEGDMVAVRDTNCLKHAREFQGHPPTGKEVTLSSTDIYRFRDGQIVEQWFEADLTGMMQSLGLEEKNRSEQENVQVVQDNFKALNARDADKFGQLRAADFIAEVPGVATPLNVEQTWIFNQGYLSAFPDARIDVTLMIAQGDHVVAHYNATGTHTEELQTSSGRSVPATGKGFAVKGCSTYQVNDGKITRQWDFADMISLFNQLGLVPPM